jgi:FKBP-type peptidyl-prolyl cis-trans isomerase (trigger factor)
LGFDSVEKLKEDIAKRIEENRRNSLIETKYLEYIFKVAEKNKIQPPRGLISDNFADIKNRNPNMSDEDAQNLAIFRATERAILMNFAEDNNIEVSESDVEDFVNKLAAQFKETPERIRKALKVSDYELITFIRLEKARGKMRQKLLELLQ